MRRAHFVWTIVLGLVFGACGARGASVPLPPPRAIAFPDYEFVMRLPPDPWKQEKREGDALVCIHLADALDGFDLFVTADRILPQTKATPAARLETLVKLCTEGGKLASREANAARDEGELSGTCCRFVFTNKAQEEMAGYCWTGQKGDFEYSIRSYGVRRREALFRAETQQVLLGLSVGKPTAKPGLALPVAPAPAAVGAAPNTSVLWPPGVPLLGFSIGRPGDAWMPWPEIGRLAPEASGGKILGAESAAMVIMVTPTFGQETDPEVLLSVVLARHKRARSDVTDLKEYKTGEMRGFTGRFVSTGSSGHVFTYFFKTMSGADRAAMALAWTDNAFRAVAAQDCIDSLAYTPGAALPKKPKDAGGEAHRYSYLLNELGTQCYAKGRFAEAAKYFGITTELTPFGRLAHENLITALLDMGAWGDAETAVQAAVFRFPDDVNLRGQLAMILAHNGKTDEAITRYSDAFAGGLNKPDMAASYVALLQKTGRSAEAVTEGTRLLGKMPSADIACYLALAYADTNQRVKGIALLETWYPKSGRDPYVLAVMLNLLCDEGRYADMVKLADAANISGTGGGLVLYWKGEALLGQKQYRDARAAFEKAKELRPADAKIDTALRQASRLLGEADKRDLSAPIEPVSVPARLLEEVDISSVASKCDVAYRYRVTAIQARIGEPIVTTDYYCITPCTPEGAEEANYLSVDFCPLTEQICINSVTVKDETGKIAYQGIPTDTYTVDEPSTIAHDARVLRIPLPGLKPGYSAAVVVTHRENYSTDEIAWREVLLSGVFPCGRRAVLFRGDTTRMAQLHAGCEMTNVGGDTVIWETVWPEVWRMEYEAEPPTQYLPFVRIGQSQEKWEDLARRYLKQIADRLTPPAEAKTLCQEITRGATNDQQRVAAILRYVQKLRYTAIAFGPRARIPQPFETIVANSYGDCKDHSLLLYHLLRAAGIQANLTLARSGGELAPELPSMDQFDHMICQAMVGGADRFYDATCKTLELSEGLPLHLEGATVLVLDTDVPRLATIPIRGTIPVAVDVKRQITVSDSGEASVQERISFTGTWGARYRASFRDAGPTYRKQVFRGCLDLPAGSDIRSLKVTGLDDVSEPVVVEATYHLRGQFTAVKGQLVGTLPACWERSLFAREELDKRQSPLVFHYPKNVDAEITVDLPEGMAAKDMPENAKAENGYFHGTRTIRSTPKGLTVTVDLTINPAIIAAGDYGRLVEAMNAAVGLFAVPVWTGR